VVTPSGLKPIVLLQVCLIPMKIAERTLRSPSFGAERRPPPLRLQGLELQWLGLERLGAPVGFATHAPERAQRMTQPFGTPTVLQ